MQNNIFKIIATVIISLILLYLVYLLINKPTQTYFPEINVVSKTDLIKWSGNKKISWWNIVIFNARHAKTFMIFCRNLNQVQAQTFQSLKKLH